MQRELDTLRRKYGEDETELKRLSDAMEEYSTSIAAQEQKLADLQPIPVVTKRSRKKKTNRRKKR